MTLLRILIILVLLWVDKSYVKVGSFICLFLIGPVAGFFLPRSEKLIASIMNN